MMNNRPTPDRVLQLINGYWVTGIIGVAAICSLFTHLEDGADTVVELAARAEISEGVRRPSLMASSAGAWSSCTRAGTAIPPRRPLTWSRASPPP